MDCDWHCSISLCRRDLFHAVKTEADKDDNDEGGWRNAI